MKSHLKLCQTNAEYNAFKYDYENNTRPNVVVVKEGKKIHFNKLYRPVIHATFNATSDNKTAIANNIHVIKSLKVDGQEMVKTPPVSKIETIEIKKNKITINSNGNVTNFPSTYVRPKCYKWILKPTNANIKITDCNDIILLLSADGYKGGIRSKIDQLETETFIDEDNNCYILSNGVGFNQNVSVGMVLVSENKETGVFDIIDTTCIVEYTSGELNGNEYNLSTEGEHFLEIQLLDNCSIGRMFKETCISHITKLKDITTINDDAFYSCKSLTSVVISDGVTEIGEDAFNNCTSLTEVTIPDSVTSIGEYAFHQCSNLTSITIPEGVTEIGSRAFNYCKNLAEFNSILATEDKRCIVIDGKLSAFAPAGLTSYNIPESVTEIGDGVFSDCTSLTSIIIPDSVTSIGEEAFMVCSNLTSATIGNGVISVDSNPFIYCKNLTNFNSNFTSEDKRSWIIDNRLIAFAPAGLTSYNIPEGVTSIGGQAFSYSDSLASITIPDSVTEIGDYAFHQCSNLASVDLGNGVTSIGGRVFFECKSLTSINIPDNVTSIGDYAFYCCDKLTEITIPDSVTSIGEYTFAYTGLIDVYCQGTTPPVGGSSMFFGNTQRRKIYVPVESVEAYKTAEYWSDYADAIMKMQENHEIYYRTSDSNIVTPYSSWGFGANIVSNTYKNGIGVITFDGDITSIGTDGNYAFLDCTTLTSITIPDSVTSIGKEAFAGCSRLASVAIGNGVTSIGRGAFAGCSKLATFKSKYASLDKRCIIIDGKLSAFAPAGLTSYNIPEGVTSIGSSTFSNCTSLTEITIPDGVTSIGEAAFYGCKSLTEITIPDSVTTIGGQAFSDNDSLTSINIPNSVTSIGGSAFYNCKNLAEFNSMLATKDKRCIIIDGKLSAFAPAGLTSYNIPEGVTEIGSSTFNTCTSLTSITIPEGVTEIGDFAFEDCKSLTSVVIPDSVTTIGKWAFEDCDSLTSITIPDGVTTIGNNAFEDCDILTSITIPDSVTTIGNNAFYYCKSLTSVYCQPTTPPVGGSSMFSKNTLSRKIYVPMASVDAYKSANGWSEYADAIEGYNF